MVLIEGVGRQLDPSVNIWTLARPLIERWMQDNRGPEARLRQRLETLAETLDRLPRLIEDAGTLIATWADEGVVLHIESLAAQAQHRWRAVLWLIVPLWLSTAALIAIAVVLLLGR